MLHCGKRLGYPEFFFLFNILGTLCQSATAMLCAVEPGFHGLTTIPNTFTSTAVDPLGEKGSGHSGWSKAELGFLGC